MRQTGEDMVSQLRSGKPLDILSYDTPEKVALAKHLMEMETTPIDQSYRAGSTFRQAIISAGVAGARLGCRHWRPE
jgi:hypothetical protein